MGRWLNTRTVHRNDFIIVALLEPKAIWSGLPYCDSALNRLR